MAAASSEAGPGNDPAFSASPALTIAHFNYGIRGRSLRITRIGK
jgi:hypothetical protein